MTAIWTGSNPLPLQNPAFLSPDSPSVSVPRRKTTSLLSHQRPLYLAPEGASTSHPELPTTRAFSHGSAAFTTGFLPDPSKLSYLSSSDGVRGNRSSFSASSVASSIAPLSPMPGPCFDDWALTYSDPHGQFVTPLSSPELPIRAPAPSCPEKLAEAVSVHGPSLSPLLRQVTEIPALPPPLPPMAKIGEFHAQMLCYLWFANPCALTNSSSTSGDAAALPTPRPSPSVSTAAGLSQEQLQPTSNFVKFIQKTLTTTQVSTSVVLLSLYYVHRLKSRNRIASHPGSEYRASIVSLMLANKMLDDHTYTAKTWSDVSQLPLDIIVNGELEFLSKGLDWNTHVDVKAFSAWFRLLDGMISIKERAVAVTALSRPRRNKAKSPWADGHAVLQGIVMPLRNEPAMRGEEERYAKEVRKLEAERTTEAARWAANIHANIRQPRVRALAPLEQLAGQSRGCSSSPLTYAAGHRSTCSCDSTYSNPLTDTSALAGTMAWDTVPTVTAGAKRPGSAAFAKDSEPRPSKRAVSICALASQSESDFRYRTSVSSPRHRPPPYVPQQRLPPIIVSSGPNDTDSLHLASRIDPPPTMTSQAPHHHDLYFFSLAATGNQLMRQQAQIPGPDQRFVFGTGPWSGVAISPIAQTVQSRRASHWEEASRLDLPPLRGAYSQHTSPVHDRYGASPMPAWPIQFGTAQHFLPTTSSRSAFSSPVMAARMESLSLRSASRQASTGMLPAGPHPPAVAAPIAYHQYGTFSNAGAPAIAWSQGSEQLYPAARPVEVAPGWRNGWNWPVAR